MPQTSAAGRRKSAQDALTSAIDWVTEPPEGVSEEVAALIRPRCGWTAEGWHAWLLERARRCEADHPDFAARFRQAASLMTRSSRSHEP